MSDRLRELAQAALANDLDKGLQSAAEFLYVVLDDQARLRLIDATEKFIEKLKGPTST